LNLKPVETCKALVALVTPIPQLKATYLYNAMAQVGTDDHVLIDVLTQSSNREIAEIRQIYGQLFNGQKQRKKGKGSGHATNALEDDIRDDTSGNFERLLLECMRGARDETGVVNESEAQHDADLLYQKGEGRIGTDDSTFIRVMCLRSPAHLQAVDKYYRQKYHKGIADAIAKETSGNFKDGLIALTKPKDLHFAERLNKSVKGVGTDDSLLIYCLVTNYPLKQLASFYQQKFGHSMDTDIKSDTSGDYQKLLLELIRARCQ